ncbi:MAG: hypothetical protein A2W31_00335 [Planctomycetes bacterium RBG_16_64_10]|nr:MAG: hypothetical protein A2W31_00335 [Planctomycetes bacterium RBG_16_64_10]
MRTPDGRESPTLAQPRSLCGARPADGPADEPVSDPCPDSPDLAQPCCCRCWPGQGWLDIWPEGLWCDCAVHLLEPWQLGRLLRHSSKDPPHVGKGQPLIGTSWLNRPYYWGWFLGPLFGDEPIAGGMEQSNDVFGGALLGWDCDHYWGTQLRLGWAALQLTDPDAQWHRQDNDVLLADLSLLYYPWGDSRWRPYLLLGMGAAHFNFADHLGRGHDTFLFGLPYGGGLKYQVRRWMAVRAEVLDNLAPGAEGLSTMHNVSLTMGVEVHWGGTPKSYWPWHPGRHVW